jgi:hypothetical protein
MISANSNEYNTKISERVDLFSCNTSEQKENTSSKVHLQLSGKGVTSDFDQFRVHVRLELHRLPNSRILMSFFLWFLQSYKLWLQT